MTLSGHRLGPQPLPYLHEQILWWLDGPAAQVACDALKRAVVKREYEVTLRRAWRARKIYISILQQPPFPPGVHNFEYAVCIQSLRVEGILLYVFIAWATEATGEAVDNFDEPVTRVVAPPIRRFPHGVEREHRRAFALKECGLGDSGFRNETNVVRCRVFLALGFGQCALSLRKPIEGIIQLPSGRPASCLHFPQLLACFSKLFLEFLDVHRSILHAHGGPRILCGLFGLGSRSGSLIRRSGDPAAPRCSLMGFTVAG